MKLFALLYADDTIVLAENERELQLALDAVHRYCVINKLTVNTSKTKIMIFSRGKVRRFPTFKYGTDTIEVVSDYVYLGVTMNYNNKFVKARTVEYQYIIRFTCMIQNYVLYVTLTYVEMNIIIC